MDSTIADRLNNWDIPLKDKSILILASKPLDLINAYEYLEQSQFYNRNNNVKVIIIGRDRNQSALIRLCDHLEQDYSVIKSPDFYYSYLPKLLAIKLPVIFQNIARLVLYILSIPIWFYRLNKLKNSFRCNLLILDCWRDKCSVASSINFQQLVIIDGGLSTQTFELVETWNNHGPIPAIEKYLQLQAISRPGRVRPSGLISGFIAMKSSMMPKKIQRDFFNKISLIKNEIELFTSYTEATNINKNIIKNFFYFSSNMLTGKQLINKIFIIGYTELKFLDLQFQAAQQIQKEHPELSIQLMIHPSDQGKMNFSTYYRKLIYKQINRFNLDVQKIEYSFEVDMLFTDLQLPLHLVSYRSSLISWIKMLCPQVKTHIIDEIV